MANKSLYVGNISYSATENSLQNSFAAYGASNVRIIEGRGFAFLDVDASKMDAAINDMNGKEVEGRTLTVNEARPREERSGGGGGGGNYGGNRGGGNRY
ncbi:RNA-binding protein [soil metagenome]